MTISKENALKSSLFGIGRECVVQPLLYPLEVVKIREQCLNKSASKIALEIFREEGAHAFYKGFSSQIRKVLIKPLWRWPMMTEIPKGLRSYELGELSEQAMTGIFIATVDAIGLTPLEKMKTKSALQGKNVTFREIYKEGWKGAPIYWTKLSVSWVSFLVAQKYLRDQKTNPTFAELALIGVEVAIIVSIASAPFDFANTMVQSSQKVSFSYRGLPLTASSLIIHNIASVIFLELLSR